MYFMSNRDNMRAIDCCKQEWKTKWNELRELYLKTVRTIKLNGKEYTTDGSGGVVDLGTVETTIPTASEVPTDDDRNVQTAIDAIEDEIGSETASGSILAKIKANSDAIASETANRQNEDTQLANDIADESLARQNADNTLQTAIDEINGSISKNTGILGALKIDYTTFQRISDISCTAKESSENIKTYTSIPGLIFDVHSQYILYGTRAMSTGEISCSYNYTVPASDIELLVESFEANVKSQLASLRNVSITYNVYLYGGTSTSLANMQRIGSSFGISVNIDSAGNITTEHGTITDITASAVSDINRVYVKLNVSVFTIIDVSS